ncbi:hypothetical protein, partial [Micromonospora sp. LOL_023]|uniref:hypothetical protein n=1 Tax=Micromonospora sp. LOL_023 TaxID=3345418 RepID=UPI003A896DC1
MALKVRSQGLVSDTWNLKYASFKDIQVNLPPLAEQWRVAEILRSMDESIRSTERAVAKLEATKGATISRILQEDASWVPLRLSDVLAGSPKNGYSPKEVDAYTGALMLGLGCLTSNGFSPRQLKNAPAGDPAVRRVVLADGDLLMSRANTRELVGLVGTFRSFGVPCIYPDLMMRLRPNHLTRTQFLEILLRSPSVRRQIEAQAVGTSESMVKISAAIVLNLRMAVPGLEVQDQILSTLTVFDSQLDALGQEPRPRRCSGLRGSVRVENRTRGEL